jgi:hypothetical protein
MDETNEWLKLLKGEVSAKQKEKMLSQGVAHLDDFLKSDLQTQQRVVDILSRRLSGEIDADTWDVMHASLSQYFTEDLAYLLYWVVGVEDPTASRMQEVEKFASPAVMAFLRAVVGIFGVDLSNAFALWNQLPDNWRSMSRYIYLDLLSQQHHLTVRIKKYNGEQMAIEGPPDSILDLAEALIYTARLVGTREAFSTERIEAFLDESRQLTELLTEEREEAPPELSEAEAS